MSKTRKDNKCYEGASRREKASYKREGSLYDSLSSTKSKKFPEKRMGRSG
jgi:hypothetical protein